MILVDSSVWVNHLNGRATDAAGRLQRLIGRQPLLVGDLILCEVLQGVRSEAQATEVEQRLRQFDLISLADPELAVRAAANYRLLRSRGFTVRTAIDVIIGTFCIERGHALLHSDRDFAPMESLLGLRTV